MKKRYFKVVQNINGQYYSSNIMKNSDFFLNPKYSLEYKIGEWTKPVNGRLFVFDNLHKARYFAFGGRKIFECQVIGVCKDTYYGVDYKYAQDFWTRFNNFLQRKQRPKEEIYENLYRFSTPSILVKKVKLIKQV